ncbi:TonB family protein [Geobacter pelophilus]|uniref:TonB family protein n=1 Tax=Geoanaerobacter pelophilus TaxID=60036 RepID=A0AAW4L4N5_9BACT|nr:TonB family protein [Geoanaerobacter pelophilus]MBT0662767.1 TonB family protein [Geoanaerobacter pelophilus]
MHHNPGEKSLGLALTLSFIVHVGLFLLIMAMPQAGKKATQEPIMVDLQDLPEITKQLPKGQKEATRKSESFQRVPEEMAPRGTREREKLSRFGEVPPQKPQIRPQQQPVEKEREKLSKESLFKPKEPVASDIAKLYPSAGKLAKIEESYRKKYEEEVKESDTKFLNTDDILFGSFLRRFETAVYGVWRYPAEAVKLGVEGVTPVRITFNRRGEIEKVEILESSGSRILDDEVRRTLSMIGPVGALPKGYDKDQFHLIAFFHYGISSGSIRGRLY